MKKSFLLIVAASMLSLSACGQIPYQPTVDVVPMPGQNWQMFSANRDYCISEARKRVERMVDRNNTTGIIGGVATTVLGAGIGAAAGGGMGAALGAGTGAFAGTAGGAMYSGQDNGVQSAFNIGYVQCMQATRQSFAQGYQPNPQQSYVPGQGGQPSFPANGAYFTPPSGPVQLAPR